LTLTENINIVLSAVGLETINDSSDTQNDYNAAQVASTIDQARKEILTQNIWIFNSHIQTLSANSNGEVVIPSGVLRHVIESSLQNIVVERQRGEPLWNRQTNEAYSDNVRCLLFNDVDIEHIPDVIATWIAWRAAELFSFKLNGAEGNMSFIRAEKTRARMMALNSEYLSTDTLSEFNKVSSTFFGSV